MSSYQGLNEWSMELLASHYVDVVEQGTKTFPGGVTKTFKRKARVFHGNISVSQIVMGLDGHEYPLFRYEFADGSYAEEYEQAAVWGDNGPEVFIALRDAEGYPILESLWEIGRGEIAEPPVLKAEELLTSEMIRDGHIPSKSLFKVRP